MIPASGASRIASANRRRLRRAYSSGGSRRGLLRAVRQSAQGPNVPGGDIHAPLTMLRETVINIGAKVVRHGRYVVFQMAEVEVPRELFQEILRLLAGLQAPPALA
jgi:hypothetical protein